MNTISKLMKTVALGMTFAFASFIALDDAQASSKISLQKAQEIAIAHAKVPSKEVTVTQACLDKDFMDAEYDIEFFHNNIEFEYEIDANTGKVKSYSQKMHGATQQKQGANLDHSNLITKEQATQTALKHANVSSPSFSKVEFDFDDGVAIYEVEFFVGNTEYDYEINAVSGEVIKFEKE